MTMNTISIEDKVKIASDFLLSSPPGEVNDVFNDVRTLVGNDEALQEGVLQSLEQYNAEQHVTVIPPGLDYEVIISKHGKISEDRYLDPRSKQTFKFDHIRLAASDLEEYTTDDSNSLEVLRAAIDEECSSYVYDHYPNGVSTVYNNSKEIIIAIVDNKYNPSNYWNGKWLASWIYDTQKDTLRGMTVVNVHYYEDGNVQLNAEKNVEVELSRTEDTKQLAKSLVKEISKFDNQYQSAMNDSYNDLAENTFKGLRRALPMTRNKMDWNKILNYKIGNELAQK